MLCGVDDVSARGDDLNFSDCCVDNVLVGVVFDGDLVSVLEGDLFSLLVLLANWDGLDFILSL